MPSRAVLIVGATGQLGTAVLRRLAKSDRPVRALARRSSSYGHLEGSGAQIAFGDLRDQLAFSGRLEAASHAWRTCG